MMTVERSVDSEAKERFELGYGGCRAPEAPAPMSSPSFGESKVAGRGGCSAPEAPMPMVAPSASILWRAWRKRPAEA